jgi:hypothetical protein
MNEAVWQDFWVRGSPRGTSGLGFGHHFIRTLAVHKGNAGNPAA